MNRPHPLGWFAVLQIAFLGVALLLAGLAVLYKLSQ